MPCCAIHCVISILVSTIRNNQTYLGLEFLNILRGRKYLLSALFLHVLISMFMRIAVSLCVLTSDLDLSSIPCQSAQQYRSYVNK
jgi:hypothetical protein